MKLSLLLLAALVSAALHAADEAKFVAVPLEQMAGAKALASYPATDGWSAIPQGHQVYDGVPFEVLTKVQLAGNTDSKDGRFYVARSLGLQVGEKLSRLHLLHAANITGASGQPVAALRLHYANGTTQTLFITYGVQVRNYYKDNEADTVTDSNSRSVWTASRPKYPGSFNRLYKTTFTLRTEAALDHIDAYSLFGRSSYLLLGLTGEVADGPATATPTASSDDAQYRDELALKVLDRDGNIINGAAARGVALAANNKPTALGKMDDTANEAGTVPVDFPAGTRELQLVVSAKGFVPEEKVLTVETDGKFLRNVSVRLEPGVRIGGVVKDQEGQPVEKAKVAITRVTPGATGKGEPLRYDESTTDKRGRWSTHEVPEALEHLRFQITHKDFRPMQEEFSGEGRGAITRQALLSSKAEFQFASAPTVSGTVQDAAGKPLANLEVTLLRTNTGKTTFTDHIRTDAGGRFAFPAVEAIRARLMVNDPRFAPTAYAVNLDQPVPVTITLTDGKPLKLRAVEAPTRLNREIGPPIPRIVFSVVDAGSVSFLRANADAQGEFVWEKPLQHSSEATNGVENKILVRAERTGGYRAGAKWIDPNAGEAVIPMEKWIPWKIRAIDAETRQPILNFTTLNSRPPTFQDKFGPSQAVNGEALGGFFAETFIHERVLTIEANGYETLRFPLLPELGATNTYELKRKK